MLHIFFPEEQDKNYIKEQLKKLTSKTCLKTLEYSSDEKCDSFSYCIRISYVPNTCETDIWWVFWILFNCLYIVGIDSFQGIYFSFTQGQPKLALDEFLFLHVYVCLLRLRRHFGSNLIFKLLTS